MSLLLNSLYALVLLLASPWIVWRLSRSGSWHCVPARFGLCVKPESRPAIWLHGSSVGEVSLLGPLITMLAQDHPTLRFVISSYTNAGVVAAAKAYPAHRVIPFPLDFSFVVDHMLERLNVCAIVIVESDFWPNFLNKAQARQIPVAVLNGKLSEKSLRLHLRTALLPRLLRELDCVAVQSDEHAARFRELGVVDDRLTVTGNMKYDLTATPLDAGGGRRLRLSLGIDDESQVIVGASLHRGEDEALLAAYLELRAQHPSTVLILVPRYPDQAARVVRLVESAGLEAQLKTDFDRGRAARSVRDAVLIVDTVGELRGLYAAADIAFVGGSLFFRGANKGGHNLMEPAVAGVAILFGPFNYSFKETVADLLDASAAVEVSDQAELQSAIGRLLDQPNERQSMGQRARDVVMRNQGASSRNVELLKPLIRNSSGLAAHVASGDNAASSH
jgi:3-deoxy-D-manno-octulosonic-acid transferase